MTAKRDAIRSVYDQVRAPDWAALNLDALADVLRDLSWLPAGAVTLRWTPPAGLTAEDQHAIERVLRHAVRETADGPRPVRLA
jgi:Barstar (barnase inhibitor)